MPDIQLRPTIATDLPRLMGMDHSTSSEYVWQLELRRENDQIAATFREVRLPRATKLTYPHDQYMLADEWTRKSMMFTAVNDSDPVGYIAILERKAAYVAWVTDMVVSPDMRRHGVGTALLIAAQDWASGRGAKRLMLEMQSKNYPAIRLAQKHGYEFCGYNDHYYTTQDVALFFARILK
ncbi:MAG: GNAT family N-acetyltransferase [Anaerolineales bacterium]|nr:GNAT family N-acetyltransferase [Anaerolineales bacterium]